MIKEFLKDIRLIYKNIDSISLDVIKDFRNKWNVENTIGETYEAIVKKQKRKYSGRYYTPYDVASYINFKMLNNFDFKNIDIKILDPSCGGGYFLIDMYKKLESLLRGRVDNHKKYIIENMLYGVNFIMEMCNYSNMKM